MEMGGITAGTLLVVLTGGLGAGGISTTVALTTEVVVKASGFISGAASRGVASSDGYLVLFFMPARECWGEGRKRQLGLLQRA